MEKVKCALCQKNSAEELLKTKDEDNEIITIVKCKSCQLAYINPRYEPKEIKDFYDDDYHIFDDTQQLRQILYALEAIEDIRRFKTNGNLLDIGSAKGIFPLVAKRYGFKVKGLEISKFAAEFSNKALGIDTIVGTVEEADLAKKHFDVINSYDKLPL